MHKVIIRTETHVPPFNEPARNLRVQNKTLWQHQRDVLAPFSDQESVVENYDAIPPDTVETLVFRDNLYFDEGFAATFIAESRERGRPCRAAFRANDPAFLQQGLRALTEGVERRGDIYLLDMWYFPTGLARAPSASQTEPVIIEGKSARFNYYRVPSYGGQGDLVWWVPQRVAIPIETWVHVFFTSIVFGVAQAATHADDNGGMGQRLREIIERKPFRSSGADVEIGEECHIHPSVEFSGRVRIGDGVTIGPGCVISDCVIGDGVTMAHGNNFYMCVLGDECFFPGGASATFTIFMEHSMIGQSASLEMSVIGRGSYVGAGTIFSNYGLVSGPLEMTIDYEPVEVDMPVLGGCVGHNCRIGSGLVIYPGCAIESDVVLAPSPTRRVIMRDIHYEESDHHASPSAGQHPRQYPREIL